MKDSRHSTQFGFFYIMAVVMVVALELFGIKLWFTQIFPYAHILLVAFLISFILTPELREFARKVNFVDAPGGRKLQREAIPLLGGVAVYVAFALAILQNLNFTLSMKGICIAATIIFVIGLLDDLLGLMAHTKLLGQISAVLIMTNMGFWGGTEKQIIIIIWVVGITNAFNFLDGMDGLAAGLGAIASIYFAIFAFMTQQYHIAVVSVALAGACLGFLIYNFRPASIYMGDAGSTLIGYLLASISVVGGWYQDERSIIVSLSIPMLILGILVFDILMTSILRFVEGKVKTIPELLSYAGRDHVHHRIEKMGFNVVQTVFILFAVANFLGALALVVRVIDFSGLLLILFLLFFVVIMLIIKLHRVEMQFLSAKSNN